VNKSVLESGSSQARVRHGRQGSYLKSSSRTPKASASLRVVRGEAIWRSSSKSEMESAETPLLAESCRMDTPRSSRTLLRLCSSGMDRRQEGLASTYSTLRTFAACSPFLPRVGS
jgi:hypothetical protein